MSLLKIIYASQPFGYDTAMLNGILLDARRCNQRDGITGALICRADIYLQCLEGPEDAVRATVERIRRDDRHLDMQLLVSEPATERLFGDWDMLDDPARSWMWTREDVANGAADVATPESANAIFARLAVEIRSETGSERPG